MRTVIDKKQIQKKSRPNAVSKQQSRGSSALQFVDNRPEATAQMKHQKIANNSSQAQNMAQLQAMADNYCAKQLNAIAPDETGAKDESGAESQAKTIVDGAVAKSAMAIGSQPEAETQSISKGEENTADLAPSPEPEAADDQASQTAQMPPDSEQDAGQKESPVGDVNELELEIEANLKAEVEAKFPANEGQHAQVNDDLAEGSADVTQGAFRVVQLAKGRFRSRAAKRPWAAKKTGLRERQRGIDSGADAFFDRKRQRKIRDAMRRGASRKVLARAISTYKDYPEGSYGHGRWLYLTGKLKGLGKSNGLLSFDVAAVEVDHSPHDASQRGGALRIDDDVSRHRVAVPLPRSWHRRHKTTHGPGATRFNAVFSSDQVDLVESGDYYQALQAHLLDTFSDGAIGQTGHRKISVVARYTRKAVDYAASNIPVSIFAGHVKNTPAITGAQHTLILAALHARLVVIIAQPGKGAVVNPF